MIHRNLTLDNIFLSPSGTIKIGYFTCATFEASAMPPLQIGTTSSTLSGPPSPNSQSSNVNPEYVAPEGLVGKWCCKSDIWSLGMCTWKLRVGERIPFPEQFSLPAYLGRPEDEPLKKFCTRCFVVDPAERVDVEELLRHPFVFNNCPFQRCAANKQFTPFELVSIYALFVFGNRKTYFLKPTVLHGTCLAHSSGNRRKNAGYLKTVYTSFSYLPFRLH